MAISRERYARAQVARYRGALLGPLVALGVMLRGKAILYVTATVTANAAGYLTPTSHNRFAKIRTWFFNANLNGSTRSWTPRPHKQNETLFHALRRKLSYRRFPDHLVLHRLEI